MKTLINILLSYFIHMTKFTHIFKLAVTTCENFSFIQRLKIILTIKKELQQSVEALS